MKESTKLTIVQLNDAHGHILPHKEVFFEAKGIKVKEAGGYSRIKTVIDGIKKESPNTLFLDCGDTFHGTFITTQTQGNAIIPVLNAMGIDAMTAHWDFAYTPSHLRELANRLNYPVLSANTYVYDKNKRLFDPYCIKNINGLKIGIIGMACEHVVQGFPKKFSQGIYMSPEYEELPKIVSELRNKEKVDFIILLSHLGMPTDYKILQTVEGVDVCISGHTHNRLNSPIRIGNSILIQSGCHGSFLGRLDLEIINGKVVDFKHELITVNDKVEKNKEIENIVTQIFEPYEEELNNIVGETKTLLSRHLALESTMDNFLLKSISHATGNKICFSHGWRYGAPIAPGKITLNDLYNIVPMNPKIINVQMKGYEILELLETKLNKTYNINPFGQTGGYVQRAIGIKAYVKIENPKMHRIQKLFIENEELDAQKTYNVSYITEQAVPKYLGENREQLNITAIDAMKGYLNYKGEICEEYLNTFVLI
ncbi:bifunctional metallophosphatase/5'-nucleotidase [Hathewaya limosa]|uniref:2',3'-cyclic-nucleotide 2'-phosphodiesterase (5'-nucleotidase family) n=2 Tax=Hathewaya limosa TaxID=1536 RepID=A0ABU0JS02_HATLI|nr:2',3'-cyclic-nucleotide 2'-phosphodiesterase (5'-nucleotidase family) [Hathewaya limosa]